MNNLEIYQNHMLFIYLLYLCNIKLDSYVGYHRQRGKHSSCSIWISWSRKRRKLLSPNRIHWTRGTSEMSCCYILGDCIYSNGYPVITPYKVTDIIRLLSESESVYRRRTDNTIAKSTNDDLQNIHIQLKIE